MFKISNNKFTKILNDDIEEEMTEVEVLGASVNEINKPLNEVTENDWEKVQKVPCWPDHKCCKKRI